tara:strand:+ start:803 stop:1528 length:726 start_codon:yes stop_codon:yes gene_type:complete
MTQTQPGQRTLIGAAAKRLLDILVALFAFAITWPFLLFAVIGIKLTSPGPLFYSASRAGKGNVPFKMYKFRTMHVGSDKASAITVQADSRIFGFGLLLRKMKIDELPQFWNILIGDMSLVGPRPEDPRIVARHYNDWMLETLAVAPGVTSPGAVYGYIYGDDLLDPDDPEGSYARNLLPPKLALERAYIDRATIFSDLFYVLMTAYAILALVAGRETRLPAADVEGAKRWAPQGPYPTART